MSASQWKPNTRTVPAKLFFQDDTSIEVYMFVNDANRIIDALNDERKFIVVKTKSDEIRLLNKNNIACIVPMEDVRHEDLSYKQDALIHQFPDE